MSSVWCLKVCIERNRSDIRNQSVGFQNIKGIVEYLWTPSKKYFSPNKTTQIHIELR